jgi:hypothetical protein
MVVLFARWGGLFYPLAVLVDEQSSFLVAVESLLLVIAFIALSSYSGVITSLEKSMIVTNESILGLTIDGLGTQHTIA